MTKLLAWRTAIILCLVLPDEDTAVVCFTQRSVAIFSYSP